MTNVEFQNLVNTLIHKQGYSEAEAQQIAHDIVVGQSVFRRFDAERRKKADAEIISAAHELGWLM